MSGFCGIFQRDQTPVNQLDLQQMAARLRCRGEGEGQVWLKEAVGLGYSLGYLGESHPQQPFTLDGQVYIIADGRIDDRQRLQDQLLDKGCVITPRVSDVALIAYSYQVWGEDCLAYLLGDFAFVVWDSRKRGLFCGRDPLGVKLFYYAELGDCFLFSNTLACLRGHSRVSSRLNEEAIADFLLLDFNPNPATTTFQDIQCLPGGHCLTVTPETVQKRQYWSLPVPSPLRYKHPETYIEQFQFYLDQAVQDRITSPHTSSVSILFSGGLDSTSITATALDVAPEVHFKGFTTVYDRLIPDQERYYAGIAAQGLNVPLQYIIADDHRLYEGWQPIPEPYNNLFPSLNQQENETLAQHSCIVLYGQGGDEVLRLSTVAEMLGGIPFPLLLADILRSRFQYGISPHWGTGILGKLRGRKPDLDAGYPQWLNGEFERKYELRDRWRKHQQDQTPPPHPYRQRAYQAILHPIWQAQFATSDPSFTHTPLDIRFPFLDVRLINYLLALPPLPWCENKYLARKTLQWRENQPHRATLPPTVYQRPKTPLAGHPFLVQLQQGINPWANIPAAAAISPYVDLPQLKTLTQSPNPSVWTAWRNLRPVSLGYWILGIGNG
ncbi:asparagine synthase-related protein [Spirulina sp. CS-785/01]|uniref:asparagine synthetase B family protein n=1 Tax=Spirulina sp. CS-785/01 TaxID=3021716 RepID=UPI00232D5502|nr:asparagine synthase-related protein [Spirulina sp. CS-785/01]MDB9311890.1 asparagine synthase-related protein [Spirulina sp. CS-785/01]